MLQLHPNIVTELCQVTSFSTVQAMAIHSRSASYLLTPQTCKSGRIALQEALKILLQMDRTNMMRHDAAYDSSGPRWIQR